MNDANRKYAKALTNNIEIKSNIDDFIINILDKNKNIYIGRKKIIKEKSWGDNKKNFNYKEINLDIKKNSKDIKTFSSVNYENIDTNGNAIIFYLTNNSEELGIIKNLKTIFKLKTKEKKILVKLLLNHLLIEEEFKDIDKSIISDKIYFKINSAYKINNTNVVHQNLLETNIQVTENKNKNIVIFIELITKKIKLNTITLKEAKSNNINTNSLLLDKPIFLKNNKGAETFFEVDFEKAINSRLYFYQYLDYSINNILNKNNIKHNNFIFKADNRYKITINNINSTNIDLIVINNTEMNFSNTDIFIIKNIWFKNDNVILFNNGYSSININPNKLLEQKNKTKYLFISDHNGFFKDNDLIKYVNDNNFKLNTTYSEINKNLNKNLNIETDLYSKFKFLNKDKQSIISQNIILLDDNKIQISLSDFFDLNITKKNLEVNPNSTEKFLSNYLHDNKIKIDKNEKKSIINKILSKRNIEDVNLIKYNSKINKTISELNIKDNILSNSLISIETNINKLFLIKRYKDTYHCLILYILDNNLIINNYIQEQTITDLNNTLNTLNDFNFSFDNINITDKDFILIDNNHNIIKSTPTNKLIIGNFYNTYFTENLKFSLNKKTKELTNNLNRGNDYNFIPYYTNPLNNVEPNIKEHRKYIYVQSIDENNFNYISTIKESINNLENANRIYSLSIISCQKNNEDLLKLFFNTFTDNIIKINDFSKTSILEKYINIYIYN